MQSSERRLLKARRSEVSKVAIAAKPKIVFDNQDLSAPYTQYTFKLRSSSTSPHPNPQEAKEEWGLCKRYSEFHAFHLQLRRTRNDWESCCASRGAAFDPIVRMLQRAAGPDFPRKHMRYDTETIIHERRRQLAGFVRTLLKVYTDLEVLLGVAGGIKESSLWNDDASACLRKLFKQLERFLQVPPKRKQAEARLNRAVLALQDADSLDPTEQLCSVCLSESVHGGVQAKIAVRLPCDHRFHEDCIIRWLECSSTCPVCRGAIGQRASNV